MSGHNKWSKIKHVKAKQDAIKGKTFTKAIKDISTAFTKAIKDISTAARSGGGDIEANAALRLAVERAKAVSMPASNIQRAIDKATGNLQGVHYDEITKQFPCLHQIYNER